MKKKKGEPLGRLAFAGRANQTGTSATGEKGNMAMHRDDLLEFGQVGGVTGREESQGQGRGPAQFRPHFFRGRAHP